MPYRQAFNPEPVVVRKEQSATAWVSAAGGPLFVTGPPTQTFPHLTTEELAARWRCTVYTISMKYRKLGLRPLRVGKRLLFPIDQVEAVERKSIDDG